MKGGTPARSGRLWRQRLHSAISASTLAAATLALHATAKNVLWPTLPFSKRLLIVFTMIRYLALDGQKTPLTVSRVMLIVTGSFTLFRMTKKNRVAWVEKKPASTDADLSNNY